MTRLFSIFVVLAIAGSAAAHPLDMGSLRVASEGTTATVELDIDPSVAAKLLGTAGFDPSQAAVLADASYRMAPITTNAGACTWTTATATIASATVTLSAGASCPDGSRTLRWDLPFVKKLPARFELLVKTRGFAGEHVVILDGKSPRLEVDGATNAVGLGGLVYSGIEHIGAAPNQWHDEHGWKLADGIDHIMFLLALLLGGGSLLRLFGIATGFTVGHSITLALAAFGIVRLPGSVIEPLVALTIAATAVEAYFGKFEKYRWLIAMGFGLVHGFAFANALAAMDLGDGYAKALFGFNIGVELGQLVLISLLAPGILLLHKYRPAFAKKVVKVLAAAIFVAGMYWFFTRL